MTFEQAKALAAIGYPEPETQIGTSWVSKHAPKTVVSFNETTIKVDQHLTTIRLINELRSLGSAFYVPTCEEMLRVLSEYGSLTDSVFYLRMYNGYDKFHVQQVVVHPNGGLGEILLQHSGVREIDAYLGMILQLSETKGHDLLLKCAREVQHWMTNSFPF